MADLRVERYGRTWRRVIEDAKVLRGAWGHWIAIIPTMVSRLEAQLDFDSVREEKGGSEMEILRRQ